MTALETTDYAPILAQDRQVGGAWPWPARSAAGTELPAASSSAAHHTGGDCRRSTWADHSQGRQ
jgi:hypothetical protein